MKHKIRIINNTKISFNQKGLKSKILKGLKKFKINQSKYIEIIIVGERKIKNLNKKYRKIDQITDILTFGLNFEKINTQNKTNLLGQVVICGKYAADQAKKLNHHLQSELEFLAYHGFKHLIGIHHKY